MHRIPAAVTIIFCLGLSAADVLARPRIYYVSPHGDDAHSGTSPRDAWRTLLRASAERFPAGSRLLLEAGQVIEDTLFLGPHNLETTPGPSQLHLTIGSYGRGRATIRTDGTAPGLFIFDVGGITVNDLHLTSTNPQGAGAAIMVINNVPDTIIRNFTLEGLEVDRFTHGIYFATEHPHARITNTTIRKVDAHHNGTAILVMATTTQASAEVGYAIESFEITSSSIHHNDGVGIPDMGGGINAVNVENLVITLNDIYENGGNSPSVDIPNGTSAIMAYGVKAFIALNTIRGQKLTPSHPADNAGLDIWGSGIVVYNQFLDNENAAIHIGGCRVPALCQPYANWLTRDLVIAYNMSLNNGFPRSPHLPPYSAAEMLIFGAGLENVAIYNNTFATTSPSHPPVAAATAMLWLIDPELVSWRNVVVANNVLATNVRGKPWVDVPASFGGLRFEHNAYLAPDQTNRILWNLQPYASLADWVRATGQELSEHGVLLREGDVTELCNPGDSDPWRHRLTPGSSLVDAGTSAFLDFEDPITPVDFFGSWMPPSTRVDIGAHEWQRGEACR